MSGLFSGKFSGLYITKFYIGQYSDTRQKYRDMDGVYTREKIQTAWADWRKLFAPPVVGHAADHSYSICTDIILKVYDDRKGLLSNSWQIEIQHMIYVTYGDTGSGGPFESFPVLTKKIRGFGYDKCKDVLVSLHHTYDFRENEAYRMSIMCKDNNFCFYDDRERDRDRFYLKCNSFMPPSFWRGLPDVENTSPKDPLMKDYFKRAEEFLCDIRT